MNRMLISVFLGLLVLGIAFLASAEDETFSGTTTIIIPAALEVVPSATNLVVEVVSGGTTNVTATLAVGTNDWPLELCLGLLPPEPGLGLAFSYRFEVVEQEEPPAPLWFQILPFSCAPHIELSSPGWTRYTLSVSVTAPEDVIPGEYLQVLRLSFHSSSGLVEIRDIPIRVMVGAG